MEELIILAEEKGYNHFHIEWLRNNEIDHKTWFLECCLIQKWLRETHNIHILVNVGMHDGVKQTFYSNVFVFGKNIYKGKFRSKTSIYTYEQALEKGLLEALKLIKYD